MPLRTFFSVCMFAFTEYVRTVRAETPAHSHACDPSLNLSRSKVHIPAREILQSHLQDPVFVKEKRRGTSSFLLMISLINLSNLVKKFHSELILYCNPDCAFNK